MRKQGTSSVVDAFTLTQEEGRGENSPKWNFAH
jgi:hypothetical protein